jgi:hypothetical protein
VYIGLRFGEASWLIRQEKGEIEEKPFDRDQLAGTGSMYQILVVFNSEIKKPKYRLWHLN